MITSIKAKLGAAILSGAVALLPAAWSSVARADVPVGVPDHAEAEEPAPGSPTISGRSLTTSVPDHHEAESRTGTETLSPTMYRIEGHAPDHAEAQSRGAETTAMADRW